MLDFVVLFTDAEIQIKQRAVGIYLIRKGGGIGMRPDRIGVGWRERSLLLQMKSCDLIVD